jgi:PAS domain S-box-containing protein
MAEPLHILILEDNPADADLVQFELKEAGLVFTAKMVMTKNDFIQELQTFSPDLILSDYDLLEYNGTLALAETRKRCPDTPFILVTGAVSEDRAIEVLTQGAKDYVLKSRLQQRLVPAVRRTLAEAQEQKARKKAEEKLLEAHRTLENQIEERTAELKKQIEHRSRIEASLLKYNERLEILSYTASQLLESDKPQQLVEDLCRKVMKFLDCDVFFNFIVDDSAGRLHLNACAGIGPETAREIEWLDYGVAVCGCVAQDGCRIVAENIPATPDVRTELVKSLGIKAYACHPLIVQKRVQGTLSFGTRNRTTFIADDLSMMKTVADQVAIAMARVRSEDKLKQITERFEMAQEAAEVGTWDWDVIAGHIEWSNQMFNLFRLDPLENTASFELWESIIHPEDAEIASLRIDEALRQKTILNSDYRIVLPDGQIRWINAIGEGKYDDQGRPIRMIGICRDITDNKKVEESLRESEERYRELVQSSPEAVIVHRDGQFLYANPAALRLYGAESFDQLQSKAVLELIPEDERAGISTRMKHVKAGERLSLQETRLMRLDGQVIPVESAGGAVTYNGKPAVQIIIRDITERKQAEEALRQSEERYRALFNSLIEGYCIIEMFFDAVGKPVDYRFLELNPAFEKQTGLHEAQGKLMRELAPEHEEHWFEIYGKVASTGEPAHFENEADALNRKYEVNAFRVGGEESRKVAICFTDISERKNREKEQENFNRTLRALTKSSQAMMRATDEYKYMNEVCKVVVEDCGYTMVWIGFAEDDESKAVRPVAYSGFEEGYISTLKITWADTERGRGPTGTAIRTGKPTTCRNMLTDPRFEPWRKEAIKRGYASSIVLPLMADGKAIGALTLYSKEPDSFEEYEEKLLAELANDLSYGITAIRLRKALKESEERFHAIAANTPDHILMQDRDLRYQLVINPQLSLTETDMLGKTDYDILELRDADKLTAIKRKVLETGNPASLESSFRNSRGETEFFEGAYVPKFGPTGQTEGLIGYFRNTTERKRIEEAIIRAKEEWERTFDTVPDLIAILDKEHRVVRVNQAMAQRLRLAPDKCIGTRCYEVVHGLSCPPEFCPHSQTCRDGREHVAEVHESILGGDFLVSTTPLCDPEGQLVGSVHVARDITERKAAEDQLAKQTAQLQERQAQLEEINSELESFSYSISHDLRAPLRAIDGFSRIILRQQGDKFDEKTKHQFNLIRDNIKLMGSLIEDILSFSRVQKTSMSISVIDMDKLVREVWHEIKVANKERKIEFKVKKIKPGYGDPTLIRQVLFNLFSNAVKFTKNKKQSIIEMNSYADAGKTVYCIKDNGAGFDMAHYDKLFGVFQRLHSSEEYEGTGIGLAIVQRIINRHGEKVWAEGEVGKGATFCFTLNSIPIDDAPERRRKKRNS